MTRSSLRRTDGFSQRRFTAVAAALVTALVGLGLGVASPARAADACVGVRFIAVRGSGEGGGTAGSTATDEYNAIKGFAPAGVTTDLSGVDYAAVGIPNWWDKINLARYESSKSGGVRNLQTYLNGQESCRAAGEKWVLLGYSQGAHVIGDSLSKADGFFSASQLSSLAAVVFIADPRFNSREPFDAGTFTPGRNGVLGARSPGDLDSVSGKIKAWCDNKDPVCQSLKNGDGSVHTGTRYASSYKDSIVSFLRGRLGWGTGSGGSSGYTGPIDVVLAIDTTGSMSDDIARVQSASIDLFNTLRSSGANAQMGVVDYKDAESDAYGAKVDLQLTTNATSFADAINGLGADGGGDTPEYVLSGVQAAIGGMAWRPGAKKIIIPLGDAPGKDPEPVGGLTTAKVLQNAYNLDPAQIYPIVLDASASPFMQQLADGSAGELFEVADPTTVVASITQALLTAVSSPIAALSPVDPVQPGTSITLSAAASYSPDPSKPLTTYGWDFDGDGVIDQTTSTPTVTHTYAAVFNGTAAVTVTDSAGVSAKASTPVIVTTDASIAPKSVPAAPSPVTATSTNNSMIITWKAPAGLVDGYTLSLRTPSGQTYAIGGSGATTPFTFDQVDAGTYTVGVAAYNSLGSGPEATTTVTVGTATTVDGAVVSFTDSKGAITTWRGDIAKGDLRLKPRSSAPLTSIQGYARLSDTPATEVALKVGRVTTRKGTTWAGVVLAHHDAYVLAGLASTVTRLSDTSARIDGVATLTQLTKTGPKTVKGTFSLTVVDANDSPAASAPSWSAAVS